MNSLSRRLDKVAEELRPASERPRIVWRDKAGNYLAEIDALKASGFEGKIVTIGWKPVAYTPEFVAPPHGAVLP